MRLCHLFKGPFVMLGTALWAAARRGTLRHKALTIINLDDDGWWCCSGRRRLLLHKSTIRARRGVGAPRDTIPPESHAHVSAQTACCAVLLCFCTATTAAALAAAAPLLPQRPFLVYTPTALARTPAVPAAAPSRVPLPPMAARGGERELLLHHHPPPSRVGSVVHPLPPTHGRRPPRPRHLGYGQWATLPARQRW
jgi:hypothetical protein